jgi:hypothetical protein
MTALDLAALRAFVLRDGGLSSWTLVSVLVPELSDLCEGACGWSRLGHCPVDPSDFLRCLRALALIPDGRERLHLVAERYPQWEPTVANWSAWAELMARESTRKDGCAPKLWKAMQAARAGAAS